MPESREPADTVQRTRRSLSWARGLGLILLGVGVWIVLRMLPLEAWAGGLRGWIERQGVWGPVVLGLIYVIATVLMVPGTILSLLAGAAFGPVVGTITVSLASTTGAAAAFLVARYAARQRVARIVARNARFAAVDRAIGEGGWRIVALLRLSPAIPFNLQNYLYGLTSIRFWPCVLTSWLAMIPATFLYVYLGHVTGMALGGQRQRTTTEWILLAVGLIATVAVTWYITRLAQRQLRQQVDQGAKPR